VTHRVNISNIISEFQRANFSLIEKLGGSEHISRTTNGNHIDVLVHNWKTVYKINLVIDETNTGYKYLDFPDEKSYTVFLLRWS
jgi:hypothetical protein